MKKEQLKPYFEAHPDEKELYCILNQVFMGSQKIHAQNYAVSQGVKLQDCLHTKESVMGKGDATKSTAK